MHEEDQGRQTTSTPRTTAARIRAPFIFAEAISVTAYQRNMFGLDKGHCWCGSGKQKYTKRLLIRKFSCSLAWSHCLLEGFYQTIVVCTCSAAVNGLLCVLISKRSLGVVVFAPLDAPNVLKMKKKN